VTSIVEDRYVRCQAPWREALFTIGNGHLMTRGAFEEPRDGEVRATFINGAFVTPPGELPLLGAVPDWTDFRFAVDGEPFDLDRHGPAGYRRVLDTSDGTVTRIVLWRGPHTGTIRATFRRMLPLDKPHLAVLEIGLEALTDVVEIKIETGVNAKVGSPDHPAWKPVDSRDVKNGGVDRYRSIDDASTLGIHWRVDANLDLAPINAHRAMRGATSLAPGQRLIVTKFVTYHVDAASDIDPGLPAPGTTFDDVARSARAAWANRWRSSTIAIDGDPEAELALRYAAFQLIGAAPPSNTEAGIGARLGGFGYRHHVFWDTDIFVAPYFTMTQPDLARTHIGYRFRGLQGARRKAARFGRDGAFYAWESAGTGDEVTPEWSSPVNGEPVRIWTGELEEHITGDVAWCADHHWRWTGDSALLQAEIAEMILDGAKYWMSRVEDDGDGLLHLRNVIGPDEYHIHVDDSFYTNLLAAWQLRKAGDVVATLEQMERGSGHALLDRLGLDRAAPRRFAIAADRIALRSRDDGVWEQHEGFFGLESVDLALFEPRVRALYDLLGEERLQRTAVIKQADVLMAMALLPDEAANTTRRAPNWAYYEPKVDHGSSLSLSFHALLAAQMNQPDLAYSMFMGAAAIDLKDSMGNGHDGVHTACQGGLLLTALWGFAGLRLEAGRPVVSGRLPAHWRSMALSFRHGGQIHEAEVTHANGAPGPIERKETS